MNALMNASQVRRTLPIAAFQIIPDKKLINNPYADKHIEYIYRVKVS